MWVEIHHGKRINLEKCIGTLVQNSSFLRNPTSVQKSQYHIILSYESLPPQPLFSHSYLRVVQSVYKELNQAHGRGDDIFYLQRAGDYVKDEPSKNNVSRTTVTVPPPWDDPW